MSTNAINVATYAVIKRTGGRSGVNTYVMTDDAGNELLWETEKVIADSDGEHYFLVEAKVKEHKTNGRANQTVLSECDCEWVGREESITGKFYGKIGDVVELNHAAAKFRTAFDTEWVIDGEFSIAAPTSEYRMVVDKADCTFLLPYDSTKKLPLNATGKFNIKAKVIGYTVEKGVRATFLYPILVEDKNGPLHGGWMWHGFLR